jgi:hypothetical protein
MRAKRQRQRETGQEGASSAITNRPPRGQEECLRPGEILVEDSFGKLVRLDQRETEVPPASVEPEGKRRRFFEAVLGEAALYEHLPDGRRIRVDDNEQISFDEAIFSVPEFAGTTSEAAIRLMRWGLRVGAVNEDERRRIAENTAREYNKGIVDTAEAIEAARAILSRVPPAERVIVVKALEENLTGGAAGGESAGTDDPATAKPRPAQPPVKVVEAAEPPTVAIEWPSEKWDDSDEKAFHKPGAIINYLRRVWKPFIKSTSALVTREILSTIDGPAEQALTRHLRYDKLPKDIGILYTDELKEYSAARPLLLREVPFVNG